VFIPSKGKSGFTTPRGDALCLDRDLCRLGFLNQETQEVEIVSEDDYLSLCSLLSQAPCDALPASVVERGDGVIEDDSTRATTDADLGQKGADGDGSLLSLAQDLCWCLGLWQIKLELVIRLASVRVALQAHAEFANTQDLELAVEGVLKGLGDDLFSKVSGLE